MIASFRELQPIGIARCLKPEGGKWIDAGHHVFSDASEQAYGVVAYLRFQMKNNILMSLVMAKSRVATLKYVTIPRLELCAALMATRLAATITSQLRINIDSTTFHTDSITVMRWINYKHSRFQAYVGNRIGQILRATPEQWRHVPGRLNPADECSRGLLAADLGPDHRFIRVPDFLRSSPYSWSQCPVLAFDVQQRDEEVQRLTWVGLIESAVPDRIYDLILSVSRVTRLIRIVTYVFRFSKMVKTKSLRSFTGGSLSAEEIKISRIFLLKLAQQYDFERDLKDLRAGGGVSKKSKLLSLSPFLDSRDLLCVGGRLENAPVPLDTRHPLILPPDEKLTALIVDQIYVELLHVSTERALYEARKLYWIIRGRPRIKHVVSMCLMCRRNSSQAHTPQTAPLPLCRLSPGQPACTHTSVDFRSH